MVQLDWSDLVQTVETAMQIISFREAKTHLSRLLEQTAKTGEGFIITRAGKPVAQLLPLEGRSVCRATPAGFHGGAIQRAGRFRPHGGG